VTSPEHLLEIARAAEAVDGRSPLNEAALLRLRHRGTADSHVYSDDHGFAWVHDHELDLAVAPDARGRGVGTALLERALAGSAVRSAWSHTDDPAAAALAASHGFTAARRLWSMLRPGGAVEVTPAKVPIRAFVPGQDDEAVLTVNAAAFASHPEQGALDLDGLHERMAESWFDPAGLLVADREGEVLGFHWTKVHPDGTGEVYVVGVSPAAQGLGLGRALVTAGLAYLQPRDVLLYVEEDNGAAVALYRSLGFEHTGTDVQYTATRTD
jgi:mycothiol synthase